MQTGNNQYDSLSVIAANEYFSIFKLYSILAWYSAMICNAMCIFIIQRDDNYMVPTWRSPKQFFDHVCTRSVNSHYRVHCMPLHRAGERMRRPAFMSAMPPHGECKVSRLLRPQSGQWSRLWSLGSVGLSDGREEHQRGPGAFSGLLITNRAQVLLLSGPCRWSEYL